MSVHAAADGIISAAAVLLRKLTDCCRTSVAAVSGIKIAVARDAVLLLSSVAPPTRVRYYFACGMFYMFSCAVAYGYLHS